MNIILDPVSCNWRGQHVVRDSKRVTECQSVRRQRGTQLSGFLVHFSGIGGGEDLGEQRPSEIFLQDVDDKQAMKKIENLLVPLAGVFSDSHEPLADQALAIGLGCCLDVVAKVIHPRLEQAFFPGRLQCLAQTHKQQVFPFLQQEMQRADVLQINIFALAKSLRFKDGQSLLRDLLHEHAVVAFSGHRRMRVAQERAEAVTREVALAPAAFTRDRHDFLDVPRGERFDDATHGDDLRVFRAVGFLVCPAVFDVIKPEVDPVSACEERHEGSLLELVVQNGHVGFASGADREPSGGIPSGDRQRSFGGALAHAADANAPGKQLVSDSQETRTVSLDGGLERVVLVDVRVAVEQVLAWNTHVIKQQFGIVDAIQPHFMPVNGVDISINHALSRIMSRRSEKKKNPDKIKVPPEFHSSFKQYLVVEVLNSQAYSGAIYICRYEFYDGALMKSQVIRTTA